MTPSAKEWWCVPRYPVSARKPVQLESTRNFGTTGVYACSALFKRCYDSRPMLVVSI